MRFVLDASITINWAMPDESHPTAELALRELSGESSAIVPGIWWYEVRNVLVLNERRKRIVSADSMKFLGDLQHFDIEVDNALDSTAVLDLARKHGRSVYDAAYLALAFRERLPLATLDSALQSAASAIGISLLA